MAEIRPEIWVDDPGQTIQYYEQVLEFKRRFANEREGRVVFGEVEFNGSNPIMVAQAHEGPGAVAAVLEKLRQGGPTGKGVLIFVEAPDLDIDAYHDRLVSRGVKIIEPLRDQPWGERTFRIEDQHGYVLTFARPQPASR